MNRKLLVNLSSIYLMLVPLVILGWFLFVLLNDKNPTNTGIGPSAGDIAALGLFFLGPFLLIKFLGGLLVSLKRRIGLVISLVFLGLESLNIMFNILTGNSFFPVDFIYLPLNIAVIYILFSSRKFFT